MARARPKDNFPKVEQIVTRTDEEKVTQAPIIVELGGKPYSIRPLVIKEAREWRKQLAKEFEGLTVYLNVTSDDPRRYIAAINDNLVLRPDAVIDLFFAYARDLPRDEIESSATDAEIGEAFGEILKVALPLAGGLAQAMGRLSQSGKPSS